MVFYRIKEKFFLWEPFYNIWDDQDNIVYSLHRKWSVGQAIEMKDAQDEAVLTLRKKVVSWGPAWEVVRNDTVVVASIKEKKVSWFGQERRVLEMADVEYFLEDCNWNSKKSFSIQSKEGGEMALVYQNWRGCFWANVKVDAAYYEGEALKDMCSTVLAACIIMLEILRENDRETVKLKREKQRLEQQLATRI